MNALLKKSGLAGALASDLPNTYFLPPDSAFLLDLGVSWCWWLPCLGHVKHDGRAGRAWSALLDCPIVMLQRAGAAAATAADAASVAWSSVQESAPELSLGNDPNMQPMTVAEVRPAGGCSSQAGA